MRLINRLRSHSRYNRVITTGWCLAMLVVLAVCASTLRASPLAIALFVALQVALAGAFVLAPQRQGGWALFPMLGACSLVVVLVWVLYEETRTRNDSLEPAFTSLPAAAIEEGD